MWRYVTSFFLILFALSNACAFEFTINGEWNYRYRYIGRTGPNDLFGNANVAQSTDGFNLTSIGLSGRSGAMVVPEGYSSKGSSGAWGEQRFVFFPTFKLNEAIKLRGEFSFQGNLNSTLSNLYGNGEWIMPTSRGEESKIGMAYGQLRSAWITMQMPIGIVDVGRRPFGFGTGWSGYHVDNFATSSIMLDVPYGPMSFIVGVDTHDSGEYSDPYDIRNTNLTPLTIASTTDTNENRKWNVYGGMKYMSGPFDMGTLARVIQYQNVHSVPSPTAVFTTLRDDQTASFASQLLGIRRDLNPIYADVSLWQQTNYLKYFNGRWFFNGEYTWQYVKAQRNGRLISGYPRAYMLEFGSIMGPSKTSLAYFYRSGHERSGGQLNTTSETGQSETTGRFVSDKWSQYLMFGGGDAAIKPYTFLIGLYGGGNNAYDRMGDPTFIDFRAAALRLDWAVAANLNLFWSFMYAQRASTTSSWWGQYSGGARPAEFTGLDVPDTNLGVELDVGMDWKLLENMNASIKFGYWQPGKWFSYAYQDLASQATYSVPNTSGGTDNVSIKVNPGRQIDPIMGLEVNVGVTF
jgi:hypothetical protein